MFKVLQRAIVFGYRKHYYKFEQAVEDMKRGQKFINKELMQNERLQLWALYKQATQGDAKQGQLKDDNDQPNVTQSREELNKYEAWKKYLGKPKQEAKEAYVKAVRELMERHGYDQKTDI